MSAPDASKKYAALYPHISPEDPPKYKNSCTPQIVGHFIEHCYHMLQLPRSSPDGKHSPTQDAVVVMNYFRRYYQNSTSMVMCTEAKQIQMSKVLLARLVKHLKLLKYEKRFQNSHLIVRRLERLFAIGLNTSINWVELLTRLVLLEEIQQEMFNGPNSRILPMKRGHHIDDTEPPQHAKSGDNEFGLAGELL